MLTRELYIHPLSPTCIRRFYSHAETVFSLLGSSSAFYNDSEGQTAVRQCFENASLAVNHEQDKMDEKRPKIPNSESAFITNYFTLFKNAISVRQKQNRRLLVIEAK